MRTKLYKIAQAATLALAITLTLSCSGGDDNGGGDPSSDSGTAISSSSGGGGVINGNVKSITITGIPSGYSNAKTKIEIADCWDCREQFESSSNDNNTISNGKVTINLYRYNRNGDLIEYKGSGNFWIFLSIYTDADGTRKAFPYTEGKTLAELGIVPCMDKKLRVESLPKYNAQSENPSISFNLFKELADETGCPDEED
jgi:hypothetical protein